MSRDNGVESERRLHGRKSCLISVSWSTTSNIISNTVHNISYSGVFIETKETFEIGQEISLTILAPFKLKHIKRIEGVIVRIDPRGIGVRFKNDTQEQQEMIKGLIESL